MTSNTNCPKQFRNPPHRHLTKASVPELLGPLQATTKAALDTYVVNAEAKAKKDALIPRPMPCFYHKKGCDKNFDIGEELSVHVTVGLTTDHDHEWCEDCQLGFFDYKDYKRHLVVAPNNIHHYCPVCGVQETKSEATMHLHVQKAHKAKRLTCLGCGFIVDGAISMLEHFREGVCSALQKRTDIIEELPESITVDGVCEGECFTTATPVVIDIPGTRSFQGHSRASSIISTTSMTSATTTRTDGGTLRLVKPKSWKPKQDKLVIHQFNGEQRSAMSYGFRPKRETLEEFGQRCYREGNVSALENVPWSGGMPVPSDATKHAIREAGKASTNPLPANSSKGILKPNLIPSAAEVRAISAAEAISAPKTLSSLSLQRVNAADAPVIPALTPARPRPLTTPVPPGPAAFESILDPVGKAQATHEPSTSELPVAASPVLWMTGSRVPSLTWSNSTAPPDTTASPDPMVWGDGKGWEQPNNGWNTTASTEWALSESDWETPSNKWLSGSSDWHDPYSRSTTNDSQSPTDDLSSTLSASQTHDTTKITSQRNPKEADRVDHRNNTHCKKDSASTRRQFMESLVKGAMQNDSTSKGRVSRRDSAIDEEPAVKFQEVEEKTSLDWFCN